MYTVVGAIYLFHALSINFQTVRCRAARMGPAGAGSTGAPTVRSGVVCDAGFIIVEDGMAHRVAYYSRMEENPSWTPFHGGWEESDGVLRVRFSYRGTDVHAHLHTLNRMVDIEGRAVSYTHLTMPTNREV